jgi:hypothetical protein
VDRRAFIARSSQGSLLAAVTLQWLQAGGAEIHRYSPLPPGPAVELFKQAQHKVLSLYAVSTPKGRSAVAAFGISKSTARGFARPANHRVLLATAPGRD